MNGSVRKRGNKWYYSFELPAQDGKRRRFEKLGGDTKREAKEALVRALAEIEETGSYLNPSKMKVTEYMWYWFEEYCLINLKYNTQENYRQVINKHILPILGEYKVMELNPVILQKWINNKHKDNYSKQSLSIFYSIMNNALKQAVYPWMLIKQNPMQYVQMPRTIKNTATKEESKIISKENLVKIISYLKPDMPLYLPFYIGLHTGLRVSEVCGLLWKDIDFREQTLTVERAMVNMNNEWALGSTKTLTSMRTIPMGQSLITLLKEQELRIKKNKLRYGTHYFTSDHVCVKENGEILTPSSMKYNTQKLKEKLQIPFNFHSLRHTHATMLMENGAKIKDIQARLGHSRSAITIDTYSHLTQKMRKESVDIFERALKDIQE